MSALSPAVRSVFLGSVFGGGLVGNPLAFDPRTLFANGEQGAWYDPSDISTLFQDAAGSVPVTAPGQVVGRILDKSGRGNHATQSGLTSLMPIYGVAPLTGRRNLLLYSEELNNAAWTADQTTVDDDAIAAPDGTTTADKLIENTATAAHLVRQTVSGLTAGSTLTFSIYVRAAERSRVTLILNDGAGLTNRVEVTANLTAGTVGAASSAGTFTGGAAAIQAVGGGWFRVSLSGVAVGVTSVQVRVYPLQATGGTSYTGDGASGLYLWGGQLEAASAATPYQRVLSQYDVTEAGVPVRRYLSFDGVDDGLVTGTITPGANKAAAIVGLRKNSDAAAGAVLETSATSATNAGTVALLAPSIAATTNYLWRSFGSASAQASATVVAPATSVVTGLGDIAADTCIARVNGAVAASVSTDQGTGNYAAHPLYIGRRGGTSSPFNGRLYGAILRFSSTQLTDAQIVAAERWMAARTGTL